MRLESPSVEPLTIIADDVELAGRLFQPAGRPRGALLTCHGAGSRTENHALMGEQAAAIGLAALTFDFRGHGASGGVLDPAGWHDVVAAGRALMAASQAPWLAGRGASMGGCFLLLAARACPGLFRSLVLLCPADGGSLLAGLDALQAGGEATRAWGDHSGRFATAELRPYLRELDLVAAARDLPRVLLAHARDDEQVPFAHSERLAEVLATPTELIALAEGGHLGPSRSPLVAQATLDWAIGNAR